MESLVERIMLIWAGFRTGAGLGGARSDTDVLFRGLRTCQMTKGCTPVQAPGLAETLELRRKGTDTTEHFFAESHEMFIHFRTRG